MELLRSRGSEPSASAQKLFSESGSKGPSSLEASPDKGAGAGLADSPRGGVPAGGAGQPPVPPVPGTT
eukprot:15062190-Alexandrium_andersonii.AAC.1